ncbi:antiviral reverse transcriptase Drt3a [Pseudovibrio sp. SPO723]|uniref:antiviral reverse transcriptase Drt3a n=1 Tax=Nesiotobacter zosterae TaxID=392721 RepID=UPI0029C42C51|nr:antiviral reverse transcriptase Drt3a [Pseudovibrio sp. SPO723]MDX5591981.1 antiviral reverse transcriptase Drt3a [Pseudovibrio sp. SPO723]
MYDPTFGSAALARHLNKSDFLKQPALKSEAHKKALVTQAVITARNGFSSLPLTPNNLAGRTIYQVNDLACDLVLRKAAQNIRRITASKQGSRVEIVRRLKLFCEEGLPFTVAKMDIKSFYPSVDQDFLLNQLSKRLMTAPSTRSVVRSLIEQCKVNSVNGLPPGLAISAELSEFYMQDFDQRMREQLNAHYFARYVDDIVVILPELDNPNSLKAQIEEALPAGLKLNFSKSKIFPFKNTKMKTPNVEHSFDYLGFKFSVFHTDRGRPISRRVELDIAPSKVRKNKTRIVKSLLQYLSDGNFDDLRDRVRILTSGYQFFDERQQKKRSAGLQHTYNLINSNATALAELDKFFSGMVLCRSGAVGGRLALVLTNRQRKELLKYSFVSGFANRVHFRFSADRLADLMECWKYA